MMILAYPSPCNERIKISFHLEKRMKVSVSVHDLTGRKIAQLIDSPVPEGRLKLYWKPGSTASPGIYLVKITSARSSQCLRVIYAK